MPPPAAHGDTLPDDIPSEQFDAAAWPNLNNWTCPVFRPLDFTVYRDEASGGGNTRVLAGRWQSHSSNITFNATDDRMELAGPGAPGNIRRPVLLKGLRVDRFEATFAVRRVDAGSAHAVDFVFNATGGGSGGDQDDLDFVRLYHKDTKTLPVGYEAEDGALGSTVTTTTSD